MAEFNPSESLTNTNAAIHTVPLAEDGKVVVFIEANGSSAHRMSTVGTTPNQRPTRCTTSKRESSRSRSPFASCRGADSPVGARLMFG
ncbi:MAG: hypothetical protein DLM58_15235 [Pseudonocardiales bacterium]|nr:MAG: hypothetical protein DLM58_15235 [Pseudonocardiales bacterium]